MNKRLSAALYKLIRLLVQAAYPKTEVVGVENLPDDAAIIVGNHAHIHGPVACELYFPGSSFIWCAWQMLHIKEVPDYAFRDFWSSKPEYSRWFFRLLSYIIAPLSVIIFNNARTIPVYRDARLMNTFRSSMTKLQEGSSIIIFPEHDKPYNNILCDFQDKFIDLARLYFKKTGKELSFVPLYIAPELKKMYIGEPIRFCSATPIREERARICSYLMTEISSIARSLPEHRIVPYPNIPKKLYPTNTLQEAEKK